MQTQYLQRGAGRIAFDDQGSGPLVLCVPSLGDVRAEYRLLVPQLLAAGLRVVTMDLRGHGESSVDWDSFAVDAVGGDMVALLEHLNAGPAVIIGTSMAAGAAVCAAAAAPERIAGLALVGPFVRNTQSPLLTKLLFGPLFMRPWGVAVWQRYYPSLYPARKPADFPAYLAALLANLRQPGRMAALRGMITSSKAAAERCLASVQQPTLVVMGERDPDFKNPAAEAQLVAERLHGQVQLIADAGHYPHAEQPERTAPPLIAFILSCFQERAHAA